MIRNQFEKLELEITKLFKKLKPKIKKIPAYAIVISR